MRPAASRPATACLSSIPISGGWRSSSARTPRSRNPRAIENGLHLAASGYDYPSEVVDPLGAVLASIAPSGGPGAAVADIDLTQRHREDYLGDWRDIAMKERRTKPYQVQLP